MDDILFENEVALVLIMKNESRYIKEWLEYHYRIGVDKFYIYDNDSEDRSELLRVLEPWIQSGIVDLETISGVRRQMPAYNDAILNHRFDCRYMGFLDADEFIYVKNGKTLPEFLKDHFAVNPYIAGLGINWRMFGSSGRNFYEPIDVIERFTMRAEDKYGDNEQIKTIANPRMINYLETPHSAEYVFGSSCTDEHGNVIRYFLNQINTNDLIQCNHYYIKSLEELREKMIKGRADNGKIRTAKEFDDTQLNQVEDVGLRDLWRQIKSQPLPNLKDHSQLKILNNIRTMLKPFLIPDLPSENLNGQIEKFLTCLHLIRKLDLLNDSERRQIESIILDLLRRTLIETAYSVTQAMLVVEMRKEILETKLQSAMDIISIMLSQFPKLIEIAEDVTQHFQKFYLQQIQKDLELILNWKEKFDV